MALLVTYHLGEVLQALSSGLMSLVRDLCVCEIRERSVPSLHN